MQRLKPIGAGFWTQVEELASPLRPIDYWIHALILLLGVFKFFSVIPTNDFLQDDVFYADAARSLVTHGFYGINGYAETNMPPGLAAFLGIVYLVAGYGHGIFLHALTITGTLGFMAAYELLRRQLPRAVAAAICLLLFSSRTVFQDMTQPIISCFPYMLTSLGALLVMRKFDCVNSTRSRVFWGTTLAALIIASLMFHAGGIALLGALVARFGILLLRDRRFATEFGRRYIIILLLGIAAQGLWMLPRPQASAGIGVSEWPLRGFPRSYISELNLKNGNHPELGIATPKDIAVRIVKNDYQHANLLMRSLIEAPVPLPWMFVIVLLGLALVSLGWCSSVWTTGGEVQDWYFAGSEAISCLWPWNFESRFFLPVAPLAALYLWRGGGVVVSLARNRPRLLALGWLPIGTMLSVNQLLWLKGGGLLTRHPVGGTAGAIALVLWVISIPLAAILVWRRPGLADLSSTGQAKPIPMPLFGIRKIRLAHSLAILLVVTCFFVGLTTDLHEAKANLNPSSAQNQLSPDDLAADWLRMHSDSRAIVMARHVPITRHRSQRKVIWFPPTSNGEVLMKGMLKHKVNYLVVVERESSYYLPCDADSFNALVACYPNTLRLVHQGAQFRIFEVEANSSRSRVPDLLSGGSELDHVRIALSAPRNTFLGRSSVLIPWSNRVAAP